MNQAPGTSARTILIVEASRTIARQMQLCLEAAGFNVPRPINTAAEAAASVASLLPDAIVIDLTLAGDWRATRQLTDWAVEQQAALLYSVATVDTPTLERVSDLQAVGCIIKPVDQRQLVSTMFFATAARRSPGFLSSASRLTAEQRLRLIASVAAEGLDDGEPRVSTVEPEAEIRGQLDHAGLLSPRERQIVELLSGGARVVTIAQRLQLSSHTVRNHLKSVFRKLNLRGQHELFEYWHQHGR